MASEEVRGCGYRKVGGLYLVGDGIWTPCDRLPYPLDACPVCGAGIHFTRSMTEVNPLELLGLHEAHGGQSPVVASDAECIDKFRPCPMCDPTEEPAYIMMVGVKHYPTPQDFIKEGMKMGISKRIATIPKKMKMGKTVIYLAHPKAVQNRVKQSEAKNGQSKMISDHLGIFTTFTPRAVEMPVWESQLSGKGSRNFKKSLKKRGITPVVVKGKEHK